MSVVQFSGTALDLENPCLRCVPINLSGNERRSAERGHDATPLVVFVPSEFGNFSYR